MSSNLIISAKQKDMSICLASLSTTPTRWLRRTVDGMPNDGEREVTPQKIREWIAVLDSIQAGYKKRVADLEKELANERELLSKAETEVAIENIRGCISDIQSSIQYYSDPDSDEASFGDAWCCDRCLRALRISLRVMEENEYEKDIKFYIYAD